MNIVPTFSQRENNPRLALSPGNACCWDDRHYSPAVRGQRYDDGLWNFGEELKEANERITRVLQGKTPKFLQLDYTRPHANAATAAAIKNIAFEVFQHPPHSTDLATSDFRLFAARRNSCRKRRRSSKAMGNGIEDSLGS